MCLTMPNCAIAGIPSDSIFLELIIARFITFKLLLERCFGAVFLKTGQKQN